MWRSLKLLKEFEEESSEVGRCQGSFLGKGGLEWTLSSENWRRKKLFQDHYSQDTKLKETLETFIH